MGSCRLPVTLIAGPFRFSQAGTKKQAGKTLPSATSSFAQDCHKSGPFQGAKANKGFITHTTANGKSALTLSDDFVPLQTPDPHWQVVDSNGKTYLLDRLMTKGEKVKKSIVVPEYAPDIA